MNMNEKYKTPFRQTISELNNARGGVLPPYLTFKTVCFILQLTYERYASCEV